MIDNSREKCEEKYKVLIINHMINWINKTKRIDFIFRITRLDPYKATKIARQFGKYKIKEK
ncbi:MAG: hypothetical protein ACP5GU_08565 [Thermoprotei archaeon]